MTDKLQDEQRRLAAIGIDRVYISTLVDQFYARIRSDDRIAQVFEDRIGSHWEEHLDNMKRFWRAVVLREGGYLGNPVRVHRELAAVEPQQFQIWLALFQQTLEDTAPSPAVVGVFMSRAQRIAERLHHAMFGSDLASTCES